MSRGKLVVISGPSGVGKGTLCKKLVQKHPEIALSVSVTTRPRRKNEVGGEHYIFRTHAQFDELIRNDGLLEWAEYNGNKYGTPRKEVEEAVREGKIVILEIEVEGGMQVKAHYPETMMVFISPPNEKELVKRLTLRGTETPEQIARRLKRSEYEYKQSKKYDYIVVNDSLNKALDELTNILKENVKC